MDIKTIGVIGAGQMGAGIAQWLAARGTAVLLKDVAAEPLATGPPMAAGLMSSQAMVPDRSSQIGPSPR